MSRLVPRFFLVLFTSALIALTACSDGAKTTTPVAVPQTQPSAVVVTQSTPAPTVVVSSNNSPPPPTARAQQVATTTPPLPQAQEAYDSGNGFLFRIKRCMDIGNAYPEIAKPVRTNLAMAIEVINDSKKSFSTSAALFRAYDRTGNIYDSTLSYVLAKETFRNSDGYVNPNQSIIVIAVYDTSPELEPRLTVRNGTLRNPPYFPVCPKGSKREFIDSFVPPR